MPNWCANNVTFHHPNPREISRINEAFYTKGGLFAEFFPCPEELLEHTAPENDEDRAALFTEKYGAPDWYHWSLKNWGTKWDVSGEGEQPQELDEDATEIHLSFDTAWAPPCDFYEKMKDLGFTIKGFYHEPGMSFVGCWDDGEDDYCEYAPASSDDIRDHVPDYIVDHFDLESQLAEQEEWASEDEDYETLGSGMDSEDEDDPKTDLN